MDIIERKKEARRAHYCWGGGVGLGRSSELDGGEEHLVKDTVSI